LLTVKNLNAYYGKIHILQGVNLDVQNSDFIGLIGRNGVGKTTTLKSIMHLLSTVTGEISFEGKNLKKIEPHIIQSLGIGYVPQGRGIFPTLTVKENLEISLIDKNEKNIDEVLQRFPRLKERYKQMGGTLSGGELQILSLLRSVALNPKVLFYDEPSNNLDRRNLMRVSSIITSLLLKDITIIMVTHDDKFIQDLNYDYTNIILNQGKTINEM